MIKDYYKILDIRFQSSPDEIKKAFRKLAVFWHPDKNSNPIAIRKMQELNEAYEILSNSVKRKTYDKLYKELLFFPTELAISKAPYYEKETKQKYKQNEQKVREKYAKELEELDNWIKNIKFSLNSFDKLLNKAVAKADKPIEYFVYYLPYVLGVIFIVVILLLNIL